MNSQTQSKLETILSGFKYLADSEGRMSENDWLNGAVNLYKQLVKALSEADKQNQESQQAAQSSAQMAASETEYFALQQQLMAQVARRKIT